MNQKNNQKQTIIDLSQLPAKPRGKEKLLQKRTFDLKNLSGKLKNILLKVSGLSLADKIALTVISLSVIIFLYSLLTGRIGGGSVSPSEYPPDYMSPAEEFIPGEEGESPMPGGEFPAP